MGLYDLNSCIMEWNPSTGNFSGNKSLFSDEFQSLQPFSESFATLFSDASNPQQSFLLHPLFFTISGKYLISPDGTCTEFD